MAFIAGIRSMISLLSPDFDKTIMQSFFSIMPISPCKASAGCIKKDEVPVLEKVAEILFAIWPDLPTPVRKTLPLQFKISWHKLPTLKSFDA